MHVVPIQHWFAKLSTRLASWVVGDLLFVVAIFSLPHASRPTTETFLVAHLFGIGIATSVMLFLSATHMLFEFMSNY